MPELSVMIKPASSLCNMRCEYCFYHSLSELRETFSYGAMEQKTARALLEHAAAFTKGAPLHIAFQGGEPTLAGLAFFREFTAMAREILPPNTPLTYALQTNGLLIDEDWAEFFKAEGFLLGLSLDGGAENNAYRVDASRRYTTERVIRAAELLERAEVEFNILSVATKKTLERLDEVFAFYREHHFDYIQFIPCLKPFGVLSDEYAMTPEEFSLFLIRSFEYYARAFFSPRPLSVRFFDNLIHLALGERAEQCGLQGHCGIQFIVEGNGDVFPCDFYCLDEWRMGNVNEQDFFALAHSPAARKFIAESLPVREECKHCPYYRLCLGGCKRYRADLDWCMAMKRFFSHALPLLHRLAQCVKAAQAQN